MKNYAKLATVFFTAAVLTFISLPAMAKSSGKAYKAPSRYTVQWLQRHKAQVRIMPVRNGNGGGRNAVSGPCLGIGRGVGNPPVGRGAGNTINRNKGFGPGDGTGNGGNGPGDGTGFGPGDCTGTRTGSGNGTAVGNQYGPGDGTGNDGQKPADGAGYGTGTGV